MTSTISTGRLAKRLGILASGAAISLLVAGSALADPAVIYDLGGKFDKSFNQQGYEGATQWAKETGKPFHDFELQNEAQRPQVLLKMASAGYSPIVLASFEWVDALTKIAPQFPKTHFVLIDAVVDAPNVESVVFKSNEASYLAGVLAAKKSATGKVGFVGGMDVPLIHNFFCGYKEGFLATDPKGTVFENYTGTTAAAWNDPSGAGELAKADFDRGADIVYAAAGASGLGVLQAAKDNGKLAIGVDSNQNYIQPGTVLTSVLKEVKTVTYNAFKNDADFKGGQTLDLGLQDGGVGLSFDEYNKPLITDDMMKAVDQAKADIIAGKIKVHLYETDSKCPTQG
jgi:basic membrane protein A